MTTHSWRWGRHCPGKTAGADDHLEVPGCSAPGLHRRKTETGAGAGWWCGPRVHHAEDALMGWLDQV